MRLDRERAEKMWELTKEAIAEDLGITVEELEKRIEEAKRQPVPPVKEGCFTFPKKQRSEDQIETFSFSFRQPACTYSP